jgi:hypothetical protein
MGSLISKHSENVISTNREKKASRSSSGTRNSGEGHSYRRKSTGKSSEKKRIASNMESLFLQ